LLERARAVAQAELDLARVRRAKVALIERACAFGKDRMQTSLESRRNKALCCVAEYRASLAHRLRENADRIIDGNGVLRLEDAASTRSTAA
jgi:hypothetical protein